MTQPETTSSKKQILRYTMGFALSLVLTFIAFGLVMVRLEAGQPILPDQLLVVLLGALALAQFIVQLVFFLHLGTESKPRWKLLVFWFMIIIVLIIVVGTIWIMDNLNYNMMQNPEASKQYIDKNQGF